MKFEGTFQYMGNHTAMFNVAQITLSDSDRGRLREVYFLSIQAQVKGGFSPERTCESLIIRP